MSLYLMELRVLPGAYVEDVIKRTWDATTMCLAEGHGKKILAFRVLGENRIVLVIDAAVAGMQALTRQLNSATGETVEICCTCLRPYEGFAQKTLGVSELLCRAVPVPETMPAEGKQAFWLRFDVEYQGLSELDFISNWAKEATTVLTARAEGHLDIHLYKVVAERKIHVFVAVPNGATLDDMSFGLPLMKLMGSHVAITTKGVIPL